MKPKIIVFTGPTATGKTALALERAKKIKGEIVSVDSRQVYKHLDVVTGKDYQEKNWQLVKTIAPGFDIGFYTINSIPVWLYDVISPKTYFSAFDWLKCAKSTIEIIINQGKTPILVGGSYFYLQSLLYGLDNPVSADFKLRKQLSVLTLPELQEKLESLDESIWQGLNQSDRLNKRRLSRHLEKIINKPLVLHKEEGIIGDFEIELVGLKFEDKTKLEEKITKRVELRLENGAIEETELLLQMGYTKSDPGLITIGYSQLLSYLNQELSLEEATSVWIKKELQYAKRQLTFMKKNLQINWLSL